MLLIIGTMRLPAERMDVARSAMAAVIGGSRAEAGCLEYSYAQDVLEAGLIHVTERWIDRSVLDEHLKSIHMANWRAGWPLLGISDRSLVLYEVGGAG